MAKDTIHINPKNKGKFTATKKATGKSTEELAHSKNPLTRKRAIFALNAKKWHHTNENNESKKMLVRLTESDLHRIVENAVLRTLNEIGDTEKGRNALSQVAGRSAAMASGGKFEKGRIGDMANDELKKQGKTMNGSEFRKGFQKGFKKMQEAKNDDIENGYEGDYLEPEDNDYWAGINDDLNDEYDQDLYDNYMLDNYDSMKDDTRDYSDGDLYRGMY